MVQCRSETERGKVVLTITGYGHPCCRHTRATHWVNGSSEELMRQHLRSLAGWKREYPGTLGQATQTKAARTQTTPDPARAADAAHVVDKGPTS